MLAVSAGGTIPDKGLYTVRTGDGAKVGEVDEEFVYESQRRATVFCWALLHGFRISAGFGHRCQAPLENQSAVLERRVKRKGSSYQ